MSIHQPVFLNEVIEYLNPQPNQNFIDCTIGGGGHSLAILEKTSPQGKILGIDLSKEAIEELKAKSVSLWEMSRRDKNLKVKNRLILVNDNFVNLKEIVGKNNFPPVHGILLDLGLSSDLLEQSGRGFSFRRDEVLDMRFNPKGNSLTAEEIINHYPEDNLVKIFKEFGEEKFSKRIAAAIVNARRNQRIRTTNELADLILQVLSHKKSQKIRNLYIRNLYIRNKFVIRSHLVKSLARIFQALRIAVNDELGNLQEVLEQSIDVLSPQGRLVAISYHSLEDRIVKKFFRKENRLKIITEKPIRPSEREIKINHRSRSAKMRMAQKKF